MRGALEHVFAVIRNLLHRRSAVHGPHAPRECAILDALLDSSPDVMWLKDEHGVYLACNHTAAAIQGCRRADIIGKTDAQIFPPELARKHEHSDRIALTTERDFLEEQHLPATAEHDACILEMVKSPVRDGAGRIVGVLGIARDVTQRRRQEQKIREQENLLSEMSELAQIGGWEIDVAADAFSFSTELARIHEFDPDAPLTMDQFLSHYQGADRRRIDEALALTLSTGAPSDIDAQMVLPSGASKWMRAHWRCTMAGGKVTRIWGMVQDVTERRKLDESMRMADLIYRTTSEAILVTDWHGVVVNANPAALRLLKYELDQITGLHPRELLADPVNSPQIATVLRALEKTGQWQAESRLRRADGTGVDVMVDLRTIREPGSALFRRVLHLRDLTEQKRKDEQIWRRTNFDLLTGLPNRSLFLDRLDQALKAGRKTGAAIGLLYIDLDKFSRANDAAGHAGGDRILVEMSARILAHVPDSAILGRLGSDHFALVLADAVTRMQLELLAEDLIETLSLPLAAGADAQQHQLYLSASIGIAMFPDDVQQADELVKGAEHAMTLAKRAGGNRFHHFTLALQKAAQDELRLTNDLRHALARHELEVFYQPIIDVASGHIHKAEALLRWKHPVLGMISPAQFIPLAEESGLIVDIGNWVMGEAIASVERWRIQFGMSIELSVNNSPVQFERGPNCEWIARLVSARLPPHSITVEITEGMLVGDSDNVRRCLRSLQSNGAKVSLDDFGTGFSALAYLKRFEVDYLKIDKSFIRNLEQDANDKALTQSIIDLAHRLGIETIAEGVETAAQRDLLAGYGCDYLQGYLFSRPVGREEFESLLGVPAV